MRNSVLSAWKEHFREQLAWCGEGWRQRGRDSSKHQRGISPPFCSNSGLKWAAGSGLCNLSQGPRIQCSSISGHRFKWKWCPDCLYLTIYIMPGFLFIPGDCLPLVTQLAGGQLPGSGSTITATSFTTHQHRHTWLVASLIQCNEL